jgi:TMEM175 potassium channel family protein
MVASRPEHRSHFTRRLEAFSDIVFGFSLAQLALQLQLPARAEDVLGHPIRWVIFFGTFALITLFWLAHYRMFRLAFEPEPFDVFLNFVFLSFIAVLPFAMQANIRFQGAASSFALYAGAFAGISFPMCVLMLRGLARRNPSVTEKERLTMWRAVLRNGLVFVASLAALVMLRFYPVWRASLPYPILGAGTMLVRRLVRSVPSRFEPLPAVQSAIEARPAAM